LCPDCEIHGIDPDTEILRWAETKANREAANIIFHQRFLLVIVQLLQPNGKLLIADYGLQRTKFMRTLFRTTVQSIDGLVAIAANIISYWNRPITKVAMPRRNIANVRVHYLIAWGDRSINADSAIDSGYHGYKIQTYPRGRGSF
jgi:hypothetical protein